MTIVENLIRFLDIALVLVVIHLGSFVSFKDVIPEWNYRGFGRFQNQWGRMFFTSGAISIVVAGLGYLRSDYNVFVALILGILAYVLSFSSWTDLYTRLAPREVINLGFYLIIPIALTGLILGQQNSVAIPADQMLFFSSATGDAWLQLGLFTLLPTIIFIFLSRGIGFADIKAMWLLGFGLAWWVGIGHLIWFLLAASVLQLLVSIPAKKLGWGEYKPQPKSLFNPKGKDRLALPFLPALSVAFILGTLILL